MTDPIRILIADDHGIVRAGLRLLLDRQDGFEVVAEASDGAEAVDRAIVSRPDVAILDISMPRLGGVDAARGILAEVPGCRVLMLSMHEDESYLYEALTAGASGYVLKNEADRELVAAVRAVAAGGAFLASSARQELVDRWQRDGEGPPGALTVREEQVVKLIAEAHTNAEIAALLHVSEKTVESHRANVLRKLGMRDRVQLVRYAIRRGLIEA